MAFFNGFATRLLSTGVYFSLRSRLPEICCQQLRGLHVCLFLHTPPRGAHPLGSWSPPSGRLFPGQNSSASGSLQRGKQEGRESQVRTRSCRRKNQGVAQIDSLTSPTPSVNSLLFFKEGESFLLGRLCPGPALEQRGERTNPTAEGTGPCPGPHCGRCVPGSLCPETQSLCLLVKKAGVSRKKPGLRMEQKDLWPQPSTPTGRPAPAHPGQDVCPSSLPPWLSGWKRSFFPRC